MTQNIPNHKFFKENRRRFSKLLKPGSIAVFHSNDQMPRNGDQFYPFRQNADFFYLTGINQEKSILLVAPEHPDPKYREILFLIETNEKIAIWEGHKYNKNEASDISGIENVQWIDGYQMLLHELMQWCSRVYINTYEYPKYETDVPSRNIRYANELRRNFPGHTFERSAPIMTGLRMIKQKEEVDLIREAIRITGKAFERILKFVKPGVKEFQVQAEIEHEFAMNGASGPAYAPIIASGINSCVLHYTENNKVCRDGDVLLFDFGAEYGNYAADISRTIPVNGKFTSHQRELYNLVLRVQKKAIKKLVPGNTTKTYNEYVNKEMEREMIAIGLLKEHDVLNQDPDKPLLKKYFMHGTAHHLGLDVHDVFDKHRPFEAGMVFTCEPGIYIREEGIGIRIENNILVTENGPDDLSEHIPREAQDIEEMMK